MRYPKAILVEKPKESDGEVPAEIDADRLLTVDKRDEGFVLGVGEYAFARRYVGPFQGKGFSLNPCVDWVIVDDGSGVAVLVPLRRP